jgi:hypothetical protein
MAGTAIAVCRTDVRWTSGAFARKTAFHADRLCHAAVMPMARRPYALTKFVEWLKKYAPPEAAGQRDSNQTA